jgi:hypothetical protein
MDEVGRRHDALDVIANAVEASDRHATKPEGSTQAFQENLECEEAPIPQLSIGTMLGEGVLAVRVLASWRSTWGV